MNDNIYINNGTHTGDVVQIQQTNTVEYVHYVDDTPRMSSADQLKLASTVIGAGLALAAGAGVVVLGVVALPFVVAGGAMALAWRFRYELMTPITLPIALIADAIQTRNARNHELKMIAASRPIVIVVSSQQEAQQLLETHSNAKLLETRQVDAIPMPSKRHAERLEVKRNGYTQ